jgi:RNA polymerase sigma factor (sigma-70 family)
MEQRPHLSASDADLVQQARAGDGAAFATLVIATTRKALRSYDDAEDAAQEAFVQASSRLDDLLDPSKPPTWLYSIAVNVIRKCLRHGALCDRGLRRFAVDMGRSEASADQLGGGLSQEVLSAAVASLEVGDREVITLYYLVGLEQSAIAEILEIPVGTVKSRTHRARGHLKQRLLSMTQIHHVPDDFGWTAISGFKGQIQWRSSSGSPLKAGRRWGARSSPGGSARRTPSSVKIPCGRCSRVTPNGRTTSCRCW